MMNQFYLKMDTDGNIISITQTDNQIGNEKNIIVDSNGDYYEIGTTNWWLDSLILLLQQNQLMEKAVVLLMRGVI